MGFADVFFGLAMNRRIESVDLIGRNGPRGYFPESL
jgi:hypothetical protein